MIIDARPSQKILSERLTATQDAQNDFIERCGTELIRVAILAASSINNGDKILICGNGGSATDALHFTGELIGKLKNDRRPLPCICLNADISGLTAIANDYGYDQIFSRPTKALAKPGDIFIGLSTSGNSSNVINAMTIANSIGCTTVSLTGGPGGTLSEISKFNLNAALAKDAATAQEVHIFALHSLASLIEIHT